MESQRTGGPEDTAYTLLVAGIILFGSIIVGLLDLTLGLIVVVALVGIGVGIYFIFRNRVSHDALIALSGGVPLTITVGLIILLLLIRALNSPSV